MRGFWFRTLVWIMVVAVAAIPVMADAAAAMLYAKGKVTVNGTAIARSAAVFAGDTVRTGQESSVMIAQKGSQIRISPNSVVTLGDNAMEVSEGSIFVATSGGVTARAGGLRISPADGQSARFEVTQLQGAVRVSALQGRLSLSDGRQVTLLDPGHQLTTARAGLPSKPAGASSLAGAAIAIIIAAMAATSTGLIVATTGEEADTSPSTFNP